MLSSRKIPLLLFVGLCGLAAWLVTHQGEKKAIRLGVLHAMTGPWSSFERTMVDAERLAVEEINAAGGLLGHPVELVLMDSESSPQVAARKAEELILQSGVSAIIGCSTSTCRKAIKPVVEKHESLLIFATGYEGLESSRNIFYLGGTPNQLVLPALNWGFENLGKRVYLIGTDSIFPRTANAIMKDQLITLGGELAGEEYLPVGSIAVAETINHIRDAHPDLVISTVRGDTHLPLFSGLKEAGMSVRGIPVISLLLYEDMLPGMAHEDISGHYIASTYLQAIETPRNRAFLERFRAKYGADRQVNSAMETAYAGIKLWGHGVVRASSFVASEVIQASSGLSYEAPEGLVTLDRDTHQSWSSFLLGKVDMDGHVKIVWSTDRAIRPKTYPRSRSVMEWHQFLDGLPAQSQE